MGYYINGGLAMRDHINIIPTRTYVSILASVTAHTLPTYRSACSLDQQASVQHINCWPNVVTCIGAHIRTHKDSTEVSTMVLGRQVIYSIDQVVSQQRWGHFNTHTSPHTLYRLVRIPSVCLDGPGLGNQKWILAHTEQQTHGYHLYRKYLAVKCTLLISDKQISVHIMCNTSIQYNLHRTLPKELYKTQQADTHLLTGYTHILLLWIPIMNKSRSR